MAIKKRSVLFYGLAFVIVAAVSLGGGYLGARLFGGDNGVATVPPGVVYGQKTEPTVVPALLSTNSTSTDISHAFQQQFRDIVAATLPVVVEVNVATTVTQEIPASPFDFFFGFPGQGQPQKREYTQRGLGSGVIVARKGDTVYVLTNNHVAGKADKIEVVLHDDRSYDATLVGADALLDLALVSFDTPDDVPIAVLGDSDALQVGDWVFAMGNPLGFQSTVTAGIVSAKERTPQPGSGMSGITDYIQTDASINQGNSGGALVNIDGEVVGINTWIASQTGGSIGLGFAIPVNAAKRAISDFIAYGQVSYSWLGVQTGDVADVLRDDLGVGDASGAFVFGVYQDSPGGAAGIQPGDIVIKVGDTEIADGNGLVRTIATVPPGNEVPITVIRDGGQVVITVRTTRREESSGSDVSNLWPGISVVPLTSDIRNQLSLGATVRGVVVAGVAQGSPAESSGIRQGDTITSVNGDRVRSALDFYQALRAVNGKDVQFRITRDGQQLILGFVKPNG